MTATVPRARTRTRAGRGVLLGAALLVAAAAGTAPSASAAVAADASVRRVTFTPPFRAAVPQQRQLHCDDAAARCTTRASAAAEGAVGVFAEAVRTVPHTLDKRATWVDSSAGHTITVTVPRGAKGVELTATQSIPQRTCHTVARPPALGVAMAEARVDFTLTDQQGTKIATGTLGGPITCYSFGIEISKEWPVGRHDAWRRVDLPDMQGRELLLDVRPIAVASLYMPDHYRPAGEARAWVDYQLDALTLEFF